MSELKAKALPEATWTIELNCDCPKCGENIDLMDDGDFWDSNPTVEICEWGTEKSRSIGAYCQECELEFKVDLAY